MRVKFTADHLYETEGRHQGPSFKTGDIEDFRDDIAERFIRRGVAVSDDGGSRRAPPTTAPAPAPKPDGKGGKPGERVKPEATVKSETATAKTS